MSCLLNEQLFYLRKITIHSFPEQNLRLRIYAGKNFRRPVIKTGYKKKGNSEINITIKLKTTVSYEFSSVNNSIFPALTFGMNLVLTLIKGFVKHYYDRNTPFLNAFSFADSH